MSNAGQQAAKVPEAVAFLGGVPHYELSAAEIIIPMQLEQAGVEFTVNFHLSPYSPEELKTLLGEISPRFKQDGKTTLFMAGNRDAAKPFFDRHFVHMSGVDQQDVELQKVWLRDNDYVKPMVIVDGLGSGVERELKEEEAPKKAFSLLASGGPATRQIALKTTLYSEEKAAPVTVHLGHSFEPETAADHAAYERSAKVSQRRQERKIEQDYHFVERLYDRLIESATGYCLQGKPCTAETKTSWVKLIPFWHKAFAIDELFNQVRIKNA